jgi:CofH subfamily radical SAM domain protein
MHSGGQINGSRAIERAIAGGRLSAQEILSLYSVPTVELGLAAKEMRLRRTHPDLATYSIGGNIDYTNVCVVACRFCAFYRAKHQEGAFTLSLDEIARQMEDVRQIGGMDVLIQGGINPDLPFEWYLDLMRFLKKNYSEIHVDAFSPEEILGLERLTGRDALEILADLQKAGLDGMPGAAAEILVDEVRQASAPTRIMTNDWLRIMDDAQCLGLFVPWVAMVTGFGESLEDRVRHLLILREQQDRAIEHYGNGFGAFKVWPARLEQTRLEGRVDTEPAEVIAHQYIREVAIARLALDNVANHRAVWRTMGFRVAATALRSGANDLCGTGSINAINAAMAAAGKQLPELSSNLLQEVEDCIRAAGFVPAVRDPYYNIVARHPGATIGAV